MKKKATDDLKRLIKYSLFLQAFAYKSDWLQELLAYLPQGYGVIRKMTLSPKFRSENAQSK